VATLSTASTYINKIDENYPPAGKSVDVQGIRTNFKNIKLALSSTDQDVKSLKKNAVLLTNPVNDFNNNIIRRAVFQETSETIYDDTTVDQTGDVVIDYRKGNYQKFKINNGLHQFNVINWPGIHKSASLMLAISTSSTLTTSISFNAANVINLGRNNFPIELSGSTTYLFELINDGDSNNLFVKEYIEKDQFTQPLKLATYTTSTLASLVNVKDGSLIFITSNINRPAFYNSGTWYIITGTNIVV
jgi:hypothetical protein